VTGCLENGGGRWLLPRADSIGYSFCIGGEFDLRAVTARAVDIGLSDREPAGWGLPTSPASCVAAAAAGRYTVSRRTAGGDEGNGKALACDHTSAELTTAAKGTARGGGDALCRRIGPASTCDRTGLELYRVAMCPLCVLPNVVANKRPSIGAAGLGASCSTARSGRAGRNCSDHGGTQELGPRCWLVTPLNTGGEADRLGDSCRIVVFSCCGPVSNLAGRSMDLPTESQPVEASIDEKLDLVVGTSAHGQAL